MIKHGSFGDRLQGKSLADWTLCPFCGSPRMAVAMPHQFACNMTGARALIPNSRRPASPLHCNVVQSSCGFRICDTVHVAHISSVLLTFSHHCLHDTSGLIRHRRCMHCINFRPGRILHKGGG